MTEAEVRAIFLLAGIEVIKLHEIKNKYWPPAYKDMIEKSPWWLVQTPRGLIEIGWRKRVISIDWSDLGIKFPLVKDASYYLDVHVSNDDVTKWDTGIHAYSYGKAVEYLSNFQQRWGRYDYVISDEYKAILAKEAIG